MSEPVRPASPDADLVSLGRLASREAWAYTQLKHWIITLTLPPGETIVESEIAAKIGMSKTPLRAALIELEREGFVVSAPYKRSHVAPIDLESARRLFELREAVELYAIRRAVETMVLEDFGELDHVLELADEAIANNDVDGVLEANALFHQLFIDRLDNPHFTRVFQTIADHHRRFRWAVSGQLPELDSLPGYHREIVDAVRARDVRRAEELLVLDIQTFLRWLAKLERTDGLPTAELVDDGIPR